MAIRLLTKPHVSEKAARLADTGTYVFDVPMSAEKVSIRKAVESLYNVHVEGVRIIRVAGKPMRRGKRVSFRRDVKKALVTLKKGETLSLYEGV
ncbi:50S ribosomal protein L23 [Candidatus Uhrbacteria bacterium]|nr:MAG: 50S ribosomal protein L23 [Candidatus Uhrbacteria bacterium]